MDSNAISQTIGEKLLILIWKENLLSTVFVLEFRGRLFLCKACESGITLLSTDEQYFQHGSLPN